jgi:hypothetical protein
MPFVRIDPDYLLVPEANALRVFGARGSAVLHARGLRELHERLLPYLSRMTDEAALMASVPSAQQRGVQSYLDGLRAVGVLQVSETPHETSAPSHIESRIRFTSPRALGALLLRTGNRPRSAEPTVYVAEELRRHDDSFHISRLRRRGAYARWIVRAIRQNRDHGRTADGPRFYLLDHDTGALRLIASAGDTTVRVIGSVPEQLGLIRHDDEDQLPLVRATASHRLFELSLTGVGVSHEIVRDQLLRAFIARALFSCRPSQSRNTSATLYRGTVGARLLRNAKCKVPQEHLARAFVTASLIEARIHTLERYTAREELDAAQVDWKIVDILREPSNSPWSSILQESLRCRRDSSTARLTVTPSGLVVYQIARRALMSFCREKALTEALIALAAAEFYPEVDAQGSSLLCDGGYSAFGGTALEQLLADRLATVRRRHGKDIPMLIRRIRRWGVTAWIGDFDESALGPYAIDKPSHHDADTASLK